MRNNYQERKARARERAIEAHRAMIEAQNYSWVEMIALYEYLETIARNYGLVNEFRENGLI